MIHSRYALLGVVFIAFLLAGCQSANVARRQDQWTSSQGGLVVDQRECRVAALCQELTRDVVQTPIRVHVLNTPEQAAYSWSTGDIYVSTGLVDLLPDDQLRACIAHELGHLLNDRHCDGVAGLHGARGAAAGEDEEKAADATGVRLLALQRYRTQALAEALQALHDHAGSRCPRKALEERISALRANTR